MATLDDLPTPHTAQWFTDHGIDPNRVRWGAWVGIVDYFWIVAPTGQREVSP